MHWLKMHLCNICIKTIKRMGRSKPWIQVSLPVNFVCHQCRVKILAQEVYEVQKIPCQRYTAEFKQETVRQVAGGRPLAQMARGPGTLGQTLSNWRKTAKSDKLFPGSTATPQEMELSRPEAELAKAKRENEILKKRR